MIEFSDKERVKVHSSRKDVSWKVVGVMYCSIRKLTNPNNRAESVCLLPPLHLPPLFFGTRAEGHPIAFKIPSEMSEGQPEGQAARGTDVQTDGWTE